MNVQERCAGCGAKAAPDARLCPCCGEGASTAPPAESSPRLERFDRLADHPSFAEWMTWRPAPDAERSTNRLGALLVVFVSVALLGSINLSGEALPLVVIAAAGGALLFALRQKKADAARDAASVGAYPALVVAKRVEITGRGGTDHFVTLERRDGRRAEHVVNGGFYGRLAEDEIGVAYVREGELVTFKTVAG